jgi:hypothetical protein
MAALVSFSRWFGRLLLFRLAFKELLYLFTALLGGGPFRSGQLCLDGLGHESGWLADNLSPL